MRKQHTFQFALRIVLVFSSAAAAAEEDGYVDLFDGKTLEGWVQQGGQAKYRVENGTIVGKTVPNTPNSFLYWLRFT